jgi:hypothetical protein
VGEFSGGDADMEGETEGGPQWRYSEVVAAWPVKAGRRSWVVAAGGGEEVREGREYVFRNTY